MKVPEGKTEAEVLAAIEHVTDSLAPRFVFGYYDLDDIKQDCRLEALKLLADDVYDPSRPLANFLYPHLHNRLCNMIRNKFRRNDPPCRRCYDGDYCTQYGMCRKYEEWLVRNDSKANIMCPVHMEGVSEHYFSAKKEGEAELAAEKNEILMIIDKKLPLELRADYLRMKDGVHVAKSRREAVMKELKRIVCQNADV